MKEYQAKNITQWMLDGLDILFPHGYITELTRHSGGKRDGFKEITGVLNHNITSLVMFSYKCNDTWLPLSSLETCGRKYVEPDRRMFIRDLDESFIRSKFPLTDEHVLTIKNTLELFGREGDMFDVVLERVEDLPGGLNGERALTYRVKLLNKSFLTVHEFFQKDGTRLYSVDSLHAVLRTEPRTFEEQRDRHDKAVETFTILKLGKMSTNYDVVKTFYSAVFNKLANVFGYNNEA